MSTPAYRRILLKLSGEALNGGGNDALSPEILSAVAKDVKSLNQSQVQIGMVIGGGNIFRGIDLQANGINRVTGDQMGMLATLMNALALRDAIASAGVSASVMSAIHIPQVAQSFNAYEAKKQLADGKVIIFAAGTGNPFFTTDTAATLRGVEIEADLVLKATKVDGVYDSDPVKNPQAKMYRSLSFDEVLQQGLGVMDQTAIIICRDHGLPIRVFNMFKAGALQKIVVDGGDEGTMVSGDK